MKKKITVKTEFRERFNIKEIDGELFFDIPLVIANGLEVFLLSSIEKTKKETLKEAIKSLKKEYKGQVSQVQDAIDFLEKL